MLIPHSMAAIMKNLFFHLINFSNQQNKRKPEMLDSNDLEAMSPVARASALLEAYSLQPPGSIQKNMVEFIYETPDIAERIKIAQILLNDPNGLLTNNARAVVLKASGKWQTKNPPPASPYQSEYDT